MNNSLILNRSIFRILFLLFLSVCLFSCSVKKKTVERSKIKSEAEISVKLQRKKDSLSKVMADSIESVIKLQKESRLAENQETETETDITLKVEKDSLGNVKPASYEEKENGEVVHGIYINGDGSVNVKKKSRNSKSVESSQLESHSEAKSQVNKATEVKIKENTKTDISISKKTEAQSLSKEKLPIPTFVMILYFIIGLITILLFLWLRRKWINFKKTINSDDLL